MSKLMIVTLSPIPKRKWTTLQKKILAAVLRAEGKEPGAATVAVERTTFPSLAESSLFVDMSRCVGFFGIRDKLNVEISKILEPVFPDKKISFFSQD